MVFDDELSVWQKNNHGNTRNNKSVFTYLRDGTKMFSGVFKAASNEDQGIEIASEWRNLRWLGGWKSFNLTEIDKFGDKHYINSLSV